AAGRVALGVAKAAPAPLVTAATDAARAVLGTEHVPRWTPDLPGGGRPRRPQAPATPAAVYLPACIGAMFGPEPAGDDGSGQGVQDAMLALARRAGVTLRVPDGIAGMCCGTPWSSKGYPAGYREM